MKKYFLITSLATILVWVSACITPDAEAPDDPLNSKDKPTAKIADSDLDSPCWDDVDALIFDLKYDQDIYIDKMGATLRFDSILSDSRCPKDVICVWPGEVEILLSIDPGRQHQFFITLKDTSRGKIVFIRGKAYHIKLLYVHPYPGTITPNDRPYATLQVKRLCRPNPCLLEPDPGPCDGAFVRYYYDQEEMKCKEFIYGGCAGVVPFESLEKCKACQCNAVDLEEDQTP